MKKLSFLKNLQARFSAKQGMFFWYKHYKAILFILFLIVASYGSFVWYSYLDHYAWSAERKQQFTEANFKETSFKEEQFRDVIRRLHARADAYNTKLPLTQDIFAGDALSE